MEVVIKVDGITVASTTEWGTEYLSAFVAVEVPAQPYDQLIECTTSSPSGASYDFAWQTKAFPNEALEVINAALADPIPTWSDMARSG